MHKKFLRKMACVAMATLLFTSGCGSTNTEVTDYGATSSAEVSDEGGEAIQESAGKNVRDMLGGEQVSFEKGFELDGKNAKVDVVYSVPDESKVSTYNITAISTDDFNEDEIVKNILGDSAVKLDTEDRKFITEEKGDAHDLIRCCQAVNEHNGGQVNYATVSCLAWVDEGTYYYHTYEGTRNGLTYQLMVSYSQTYNEMTIALLPKSTGEFFGNDKIDTYGYSCPDGKLYIYISGLKEYKLDEVMADNPNECDLSDEDLVTKAKDSLKDVTGIDYPAECMSFYDNMYDIVIPDGTKIVKNELIGLNQDEAKTGNLDNAKRHGYVASIMSTLCGLSVMADTEEIDDDQDDLQVGTIAVDNDGAFAVMMANRYKFNGVTTENANLLPFDEAMEKFITGTQENLKTSDIDKADETIEFTKIDLVYYPVPNGESTSEFTLTPAWSLEAENAKRQTVVRVVINATDGSYINAIYEKEKK